MTAGADHPEQLGERGVRVPEARQRLDEPGVGEPRVAEGQGGRIGGHVLHLAALPRATGERAAGGGLRGIGRRHDRRAPEPAREPASGRSQPARDVEHQLVLAEDAVRAERVEEVGAGAGRRLEAEVRERARSRGGGRQPAHALLDDGRQPHGGHGRDIATASCTVQRRS